MTTLDWFVLLAGSALRLALNTVKEFSCSDEAVTFRLAMRASDKNYIYEVAAERWFHEAHGWKFPGILRFGNILLLGALYRLTLASGFRVMTSVSTVAGIATIWLSWLIAARLAPGTEPFAAALVATAPLGMHLGRRALQDAHTSAFALGAFAAGLYGHPLLAGLSIAAMLAFKETTLTHVAPLALALLVAGMNPWSIGLMLMFGASAYLIAFVGFGGTPKMWLRYRVAIRAAREDEYGRQQEGGLLRLLTDLLLLSPLPLFAAVRGWHASAPLELLAVGLLAIHSMLPVLQSVRMVNTADIALRMVAATVLPPVMLASALLLDAACFAAIFIRGRVYDPVTSNLILALGFAPRAPEEATSAQT